MCTLLMYYTLMHLCLPASLWLLCQNAVRAPDANDPTTWLISPAAAALITPAPLQMRRKKRGKKQEERERGRRKRKRFPITLGRIRRATGLNAQVKQHCLYLFLFSWDLLSGCGHIFNELYNLGENIRNKEFGVSRIMSMNVLVIVMVSSSAPSHTFSIMIRRAKYSHR